MEEGFISRKKKYLFGSTSAIITELALIVDLSKA